MRETRVVARGSGTRAVDGTLGTGVTLMTGAKRGVGGRARAGVTRRTVGARRTGVPPRISPTGAANMTPETAVAAATCGTLVVLSSAAPGTDGIRRPPATRGTAVTREVGRVTRGTAVTRGMSGVSGWGRRGRRDGRRRGRRRWLRRLRLRRAGPSGLRPNRHQRDRPMSRCTGALRRRRGARTADRALSGRRGDHLARVPDRPDDAATGWQRDRRLRRPRGGAQPRASRGLVGQLRAAAPGAAAARGGGLAGQVRRGAAGRPACRDRRG